MPRRFCLGPLDVTVKDEDGNDLFDLNRDLIETKHLSRQEVENVKLLHQKQHSCKKAIEALDPGKDLPVILALVEEWRIREFELQDAWGFGHDSNYHREFDLPHCKCPKMDNEDRLGTKYRVISEGCPIHAAK